MTRSRSGTGRAAASKRISAEAAGSAVDAGVAPKLAQRVAAQVARDIIGLGWPVGRNLGSEAELAARYGVGRWVMREAISIAASDGLLEIQRGRYGGLFVAAPAAAAVVVAVHNYLEFCQITPAALLDARLVLESMALRLIATRIDVRTGLALRQLAAVTDAEDALQAELLRALLAETGNQVLSIFTLALMEATRNLLRRQEVPAASLRRRLAELTELRRAQVEAVLAGDQYRIHALGIDYLAIWRKLLERPAQPDTTALDNGSKRSGQLSQRLLARISALQWPLGHSLGSEADLMAEFGVSRAVLREAIRPLERHGVVEMRRGRGERSGLRVARPNPAATALTVALFLKYSKVPLADVFDVQQALENATAASAATLDAPRRAALSAALLELASGRPRNAAELEQYMWDFYSKLGNDCGNPVFGLYLRILVDMAGFVVDSGPVAELDAAAVAAHCTVCERLALAIRDGDQALARRNILEWRRIALAMSPRERPLEQIVERELMRE